MVTFASYSQGPKEIFLSLAELSETEEAFCLAVKAYCRRNPIHWPDPIPYTQDDIEYRLTLWCHNHGYVTCFAPLPIDRNQPEMAGPVMPGYQYILDGYLKLLEIYNHLLETPVVDKTALGHLYRDPQ
jgi:hypothetical protein